MKNLLIRGLTGAVFVIAILGSIYLGQPVFTGLFSVFAIVGTWEFYRMTAGNDRLSVNTAFGVFLSVFTYLLISLIAAKLLPVGMLLTFIPMVFLSFILELYRKKENPLENLAVLLIPVVYVAVPFGMINFIFSLPVETPWVVVAGFFILMWTNDTFAYLTGMTFGKHRLFERISPKKSWEGFFGGLVFTVVTGFVLGRYYSELTQIQWAVMAFVISMTGTFGDLVESMFKRSVSIKDSGKLLPGHGGVLDRFDGVLMAVPFVVVYLYFIFNFA